MKTSKKYLGAKANGLYAMQKLGFRVPDFVVFAQDEIEDLSNESLQQKMQNLSGNYFAVRSSANEEDGVSHSFAGIFSTKLFIKKADLLNALQIVYESKNLPKVLLYCTQNSIDHQQLRMNVIVQQMIAADVSGVAFGVHPLKPYKKEKLITAVYGLGEGLVSGELNADEFIVNDKGDIRKNIQTKTKVLKYKNESLGYEKVAADLQEIASLSNQQIEEITTALTNLEQYFGAPQDIEFCYKNDNLFLLQSRPITALDKEHIIWDNSNIIESYPGVTLPFKF